MNRQPFFVKIRRAKVGDDIVIEYWYNTDLRTDRTYHVTDFGSIRMMDEIREWLSIDALANLSGG